MTMMMLLSYLNHHHVLEEVVVLPFQSFQLVHLHEVKPYFLGLFES